MKAYTVGCARDSRTFEPAPAVTLKGNGLTETGLATGTQLDVRVMPGCLVLTAQEPEPELIQALKKVCKLSARKQRELMGVIQVMAKPKARSTD